MWLRDQGLLALLAEIGRPRIVEVAAPITSTGLSHSAAKAVTASYGRSIGAIPDKGDFDVCIKEPLDAEAILAVHAEGEACFSQMGKSYPLGFVDVNVGRWKELTGEDD